MEEKFTPNVIEPSFGLGRIMTTVFEHCFKARDEKRTYLHLKPKVAPVKVSILPLQSDERFIPIIADISNIVFTQNKDSKEALSPAKSMTQGNL